ncbi:MAG: UbiD family decarboxylase, partial [Mariniblastus sp.]|nr:UbiD family decarboxylase [Mariniblastus sp.]
IGIHHRAAIDADQPFRVNIFVGGNPAMTVAAVMPLPEGMSELTFAGALAGHRIPMIRQTDRPAIYADADFCISGVVDPDAQKPEGPFGDHLGYYSLTHPFPFMRVDRVLHRSQAVWPFTVVGRPPQEDTVFGELIHELTGPVIPTVLPGVKAVNAVDASGVHPLLLAIGSERYVPYQPTTQPQEILTQANAILGQGQMSLAKYLWIIDQASAPDLNVNQIDEFFCRTLERIDWRRDLHFQTRTTIDTLDYSGSGFNQGSKVVVAAAGPAIRQLANELPADLQLPPGLGNPQLCLPGILAINGPKFQSGQDLLPSLLQPLDIEHPINRFPLVLVVDDSEFCARTLNNFLWTVFTRSNPASDIHGIGAQIIDKHWGCQGSLVIDARIKPQHAPPLVEDPEITKRVDQLAGQNQELGPYL